MTYKFTDNSDKYLRQLQANIAEAGVDIKEDLVNTSRATAPHKTGQLEKGITGEINHSGLGFKITVGATAVNSAGQDYAPKMHFTSYKLGPQSAAKGQGYSGLTGKSFPVGNNYIYNPLNSNFNGYVKHIAEAINKTKV